MNIANKLTVFRIILIPFLILAMLLNKFQIALGVFLIASFTDFLDGYLARKLGIVTSIGKFIDPLADKLLVLSALMVFVQLGGISSVIVIIIFSRELVISIFRAIAANQGVLIAAGSLGKIKTIMQFLLIIGLFAERIMVLPQNLVKYGLITIIAITTFFTIASGVEYIYKNRSVLRN